MASMKLHRLWRCLAAAVAALALALCFGTAAFAYGAVDTTKEASLTVCFGKDGAGFSGVAFRVYRVADVSAGGQFALTGSFAGYPVAVDGLDSAGWRTLAQTLDAYVARDGLTPQATAETGADGRAVFARLATGLYLVTGDPCRQGDTTYTPEPFLVCLPGQDRAGEDWVYDVTAACKYDSRETPPGPEEQTVSREVLKVWKDEGRADSRPQAVTVQLLRDGAVYDTVTLNEANNWRYTWTGLDSAAAWQVTEAGTPAGYTVTVEREGATFVVTNTSTTPPESPPAAPAGPGLPQTGALWWPVPLLACGGLLLFFLGWARRRGDRDA